MRPSLACSTLLLLMLTACRPDTAEVREANGATSSGSPAVPLVTTPMAAEPAVLPAAAVEGPATFSGYGDMVLGSTASEAVDAWAGELQGEAFEPHGCYYLSPRGVRIISDLAFMIEGDRFVRYDVGTAKQGAPGGGKVGMTAQELDALYGAMESLPHKYVEGGRYLSITASGVPPTKLVFETDAAGTVTSWRVGVEPQVDYVEGCS